MSATTSSLLNLNQLMEIKKQEQLLQPILMITLLITAKKTVSLIPLYMDHLYILIPFILMYIIIVRINLKNITNIVNIIIK